MKIPTSSSSENSSNPHQVNDDQSDETGNGSTNGSHNEDIRQSQRHEEAMFGAVDRFCNASEQTYEEFLTCFSYFRPGPEERLHSQWTLDTDSTPTEPHQQQVVQSSRTDPHPQISLSHHDNSSDSDNELEEEVLTGSLLPESADVSEPNSRPLIKLDNFVDDEGVTDDSEDEEVMIDGYQPYVASFASTKPEITENDQQTAISGSEPDVSETSTSDVDEDGEADKESKQMPSVPTMNQSSDVCHGPPDVQTVIKYDSTGELVSHLETDDNICKETDQDQLYPGEIIEGGSTVNCRTLEEITHVRQMEYSAKMADTETGVLTAEELNEDQNHDAEQVSDEVQPFSLDNNFDYDNVILTPKYSQCELHELKATMDKVKL